MRIPRSSFLHLTNMPASHLLQTPMRDASLNAFDLRTAHEATGVYLALTLLTPLLGLETYPIPHVQDNSTDGFRVRNEATTLIVPLMRDGVLMAFGVARAFKTAAFAHARV
jgi:uracil phosphoribosyltransferase